MVHSLDFIYRILQYFSLRGLGGGAFFMDLNRIEQLDEPRVIDAACCDLKF